MLVYLLLYMTSWFCFSPGALVAGHASTLLVPPIAVAKQEGSAADTQREDERCKLGSSIRMTRAGLDATRARTTSRGWGWMRPPTKSKQVLVTRCPGASHYLVVDYLCTVPKYVCRPLFFLPLVCYLFSDRPPFLVAT